MYSGIHSIMPLEDFPRPNLVGDPCLVLTMDPKPRLRWTAEFHERFVDAFTQLGGPDRFWFVLFCMECDYLGVIS
ncbi:putative transcription factor MYB-HB-like family [Helianthus anomalus]